MPHHSRGYFPMLFFVFPPYEYNLFFPDIIKREEFKKGMFMLPAIILIVILLLMLLCFTWVSMAKNGRRTGNF
jgi:hypothetical protein